MPFLINLVIPTPGQQISVSGYINALVNLGYSRKQAICSLGGISGRSATIHAGIVVRI